MTASVDENGDPLYRKSNWLRTSGSHDASIGVIARGDGNMIVNGNPSKFLQGHNIFGPECVRELALRMAVIGAQALGIEPNADDLDDWAAGRIEIKTLDITYSIPLASRGQVLGLLKQMEQTATFRHRGRGQLTKGTTLYFGKHSTRSSFKLYSKGDEINAPKHKLHPRLLATDLGQYLHQFADPLLRTEVRLLSPELKRIGCEMAHHWDIRNVRKTHHSFWEKLNMAKTITKIDETVEKLPERLRTVAQCHLNGQDTRNLCNTRTWYRHRKALLPHGIDLAANNGNVVKQRRIEIVDEPPIVLRFDYNNQVPDIVRGTVHDPACFGTMEHTGRVPHDIAQLFPRHFAEDLAYHDALTEDQLDLFH